MSEAELEPEVKLVFDLIISAYYLCVSGHKTISDTQGPACLWDPPAARHHPHMQRYLRGEAVHVPFFVQAAGNTSLLPRGALPFARPFLTPCAIGGSHGPCVRRAHGHHPGPRCQ